MTIEGRVLRLRQLLRTEFAQLFSDTAVVFVIRLSAALITYVTQVILANWMGAEQLGLFVYAIAWLWILNVIACMGLTSAAYRFIPEHCTAGQPELAKGFVHWSRASVVKSGLIIGAIGLLATVAWHRSDSLPSQAPLLLAFLALPFTAFTTIQSGIARAWRWFPFASVTGVLLRPALLLTAVTVAWLASVRLSAALVLALFVAVVVLVSAVQFAGIQPRLAAVLGGVGSDKKPRLWLRVALPIVIAELFVSYFVDINVIVSGTYLAPAEIAVYNAALRTVAIIAFGITAVGSVVAPRAAELFARGDMRGLQRLYSRATRLMFWPSLLALLLLVSFGRFILGLFGEEFVIGYGVLLIVGGTQVLVSAAGPLLPVLNVAGQQNRCVIVFAIALLLTPALYWLLVPRYGMLGGAISLLLVNTLWCAWLYLLAARYVGVGPAWITAVVRGTRDAGEPDA